MRYSQTIKYQSFAVICLVWIDELISAALEDIADLCFIVTINQAPNVLELFDKVQY